MKIRQSLGAATAVFVLALTFGHPAHRAEGADAAEARLQRLEDIEAIRNLRESCGDAAPELRLALRRLAGEAR